MATQGYNIKDNNPFYNQVNGAVKKEIDYRSSIYSARERGGPAGGPIHMWLYRKNGYVRIYYGEDAIPILEPPKEGFRSVYGKSLYPPAVVTSVRISNEGDYGSLLKADINFSVFTLSQLENFTKTLLTVKAGEDDKGNPKPIPVKIEYGWSVPDHDGPKEEFYGFVTNFNWSLRPDGGFDCVSNLVGEGFFSLNTKADAPLQKNSTLLNRVLAGVGVSVGITPNTWVSAVKYIDPNTPAGVYSGVAGKSPSLQASFNGVVLLDLDLSEAQSENKDTEGKALNKTRIHYVTLEWICFAVSQILHHTGNGLFPKDQYISDSNITVGHKYDDIVSSNPKNILFPGFANYGTESLTKDIDSKISMATSSSPNSVDLSKILVSIEFIYETLKAMQTQPSMKMNEKNVDTSLVNLFNKIFTEISNCSGGIYQLSLSQPKVETSDPNYKESLKQWVIVDTKYMGDAVTATIIPVVKSGDTGYSSIVRSVTMTSKLPGSMATAQFVAAASSLSGNTPALAAAKTEANTNDTKDTKTVTDALLAAKKAALTSGFTPDSIDNIQEQLKDYWTYVVGRNEKGKRGSPLPLDLSITMDGLKGFRFGNTLKIDYLPSDYKDVVFTVTKIEHNITNNDWTTTLSTVSRLKV
jgi:hypothetical protein